MSEIIKSGLRYEDEEQIQQPIIHKNINENADSLEIGSASKGGKVKVYGDFNSPEEFKDKLAKAKLVRDYANANICVNV